MDGKGAFCEKWGLGRVRGGGEWRIGAAARALHCAWHGGGRGLWVTETRFSGMGGGGALGRGRGCSIRFSKGLVRHGEVG